MQYLRQSTASQEVPLGYFVDSTDGNTEETGLTIANTDIKIWKTGATTLADKNSGGATHISNGIYYAVLDATDTNTIGPLTIFCHVSGALATRLQCCVLDEAVYDAMFGTTALATATNITAGTITTTTNLTNLPTIPNNWITAAGINTGAITAAKFAAGAIDAAAIADNAIDAGAIAANAITAAKIADGAIDAATFAADVDAEILSYLVDDATRIDASALNTATGTTIPAIVADTNELQTDWANGGRLDLILDARASQASVDDLPTNAELTTALGTADDAILAVLGTPAGVSMSADIAAIKAETASILTDTAEIGAAGAGLTAVPWNASWDAEVQSEVTDALNAYDPPTKAELDAAVANVSVDEIQASALADLFNTDSGTTYGSAVAGSVVKEIADNAGGSSLSEAGIASAVRTELTTELGRIDVATSTRASQTSVDDIPTAAENADAIWDESVTGHVTVDTYGARIGTRLDNTITSRMASYTQPTGFLAATFPTTVGDATAAALTTVEGKIDTVDTVADAIKAKTDSLTFTVPGQADVNIQYVNDVEVTGNGQSGTEWGPA